MSQSTPIAVAVVEHQGRFLIGRRPEGGSLAGLWEFPGGKVDAGETPAQAAARECREETGLEISVGPPYPEHVHRYDHDRVHLHFFACTPLDPEQQPRAPFCWVERSELASRKFPAGNRLLLVHLLGESTC